MLLKFPIILSSNSFSLPIILKIIPWNEASNLTCIFCYKLRYNCYIWLTSTKWAYKWSRYSNRAAIYTKLSSHMLLGFRCWTYYWTLYTIFIISEWTVLLFININTVQLFIIFIPRNSPNILESFFMLWGSYYSRNYSSIMCSSLYVGISQKCYCNTISFWIVIELWLIDIIISKRQHSLHDKFTIPCWIISKNLWIILSWKCKVCSWIQ